MYMLAYTHTLYVHACVYKLGGVLDKLCAFPADEGYNNILTSLKRLSRIQGLAWPHHDYFAMYILHTCTCTIHTVGDQFVPSNENLDIQGGYWWEAGAVTL